MCALVSCFWLAWTALVIFVNAYTAWFAMNGVIGALGFFGHMIHPQVMGAMLTGIKPIRNTLNLLVFVCWWREHAALLTVLNTVDEQFAYAFGTRPPWRTGANVVMASVVVVFVSVGMGRALEFFTTFELMEGNCDWFCWASLVIAPSLAVWQLLPLFYFTFLCVCAKRWFVVLSEHMNK
jgi:hypothetical protein